MSLTKGNPVRVSLSLFLSALFFSKSEKAWMIWRWANVQKMGDEEKRKSKKKTQRVKDFFYALKKKIPWRRNKWQVHSWLGMYSAGFASNGSLSLLTVPAKTCQRLRDLANCKWEAKSSFSWAQWGHQLIQSRSDLQFSKKRRHKELICLHYLFFFLHLWFH